MLDRLTTRLAKRPTTALLLVALVTVAALAGLVDPKAGRLRLEFDPSTGGLVPEGDESAAFLERTRRIFGTDDGIVVVLPSEDVFSEDTLARVARLSERLAELDGVSGVLSLSTASHIRAVDGDVEIGPFFEVPPRDPEELERIRREVLGNPLYVGGLVSEDARATALMVYFDRLSDREFLAGDLHAQIVATAERVAGDEVWISGRRHILAATSDVLLADMARIVPLIFLAAALVLAVAFRSVAGVVIPLLTIAIALIWTLGLVGWAGIPLNLVTSIVPPLVITIGFAYAMHVVAEYLQVARAHGNASRSELVAHALRDVGLPLLFTGVTTVLGFAALLASPMAAIREFGAFAVLGVVSALVASLTFAPAAIGLFATGLRSREGRVERGLLRIADAAAGFDHRHRKAILVLGVLALGLAAVGMARIQVGATHVDDFDPTARVRTDYEAINEAFAGANPFQIVVEANGRDAFTEPANLRTLRELQQWLEEQPDIGMTASVVDYLMLLNRALHDDDPEWFAIPESQRLAKQLFFFGASEQLDHFLDGRYATASISIRARVNDSRSTAALLDRIEARLAELPDHMRGTPTGEIVMLNRSLDEIARGQLRSLALAMLTIYAVLALMFSSFRVGFMALLPNALPIAFFFGTLGFTGIPLSASTSLIACIALGIAVDDTIHYFARFNAEAKRRADERGAMVASLRAVVGPVTFTSIGLCLGFLALTSSDLRNQVDFGVLAASTLAVAWLIDMTLTPALCTQLKLVTLWDLLTLDLGDDPHLSIPLFAGLTPRQAKVVALMLSVVDHPAGSRIFDEGDVGREMYVVIEGELRGWVTRHGQPLDLAKLRRGDTVGEVAIFSGRRTANLDALTDVRLLRIAGEDLEPLRRRYPQIAARLFENLTRILAERFTTTVDRLG